MPVPRSDVAEVIQHADPDICVSPQHARDIVEAIELAGYVVVERDRLQRLAAAVLAHGREASVNSPQPRLTHDKFRYRSTPDVASR